MYNTLSEHTYSRLYHLYQLIEENSSKSRYDDLWHWFHSTDETRIVCNSQTHLAVRFKVMCIRFSKVHQSIHSLLPFVKCVNNKIVMFLQDLYGLNNLTSTASNTDNAAQGCETYIWVALNTIIRIALLMVSLVYYYSKSWFGLRKHGFTSLQLIGVWLCLL